jgi:superfamily II DNA/RNA helicase
MPIWFRNRPSELADPTEQVVAERLNRLSDECRICWGYYYNPNRDQGHSREGLLDNFLDFLASREVELEEILAALKSIQPSFITVRSQTAGDNPKKIIQAVQLVNGETDKETRDRAMLAFNTPFFPDILISSSVLTEGVDLHLACRHVIHHNLSWNPSTLEQRTGRVDRIGGKVERVKQPIHVYMPFIAATQDEKQYRVVMDRESWFNVLMGDEFKLDFASTEARADRMPLPQFVSADLRFNLHVS